MHVVFIVAALGAGGAERVIAQLSSGWAAGGRTVTVISFDGRDTPVFHQFGPQVQLLRLGVPGAGVRIWLRRLFALRAALRRIKPDIVISFLTKINVVTLIATMGMRVPIIVSERNNPREQAASRLWTLLLDRLYPRADNIVLQTAASRECLPPAVVDRAVVIANPVVQAEAPPPIPQPGGGILVAVGRLTAQKGFDLLLQAFAQVAARYPQWQVEIWGHGPDRDALIAQADTLGITDRVVFAGLTATPLAWTKRADAFVLSSRYEGWANALAEAMAAGCAVASFDCRYGPGELIRNEVDGLLVPNGDVGALAEALSRLMADDRLRARLGVAARASMTACEPARIMAKWDTLLSALVPETAAP